VLIWLSFSESSNVILLAVVQEVIIKPQLFTLLDDLFLLFNDFLHQQENDENTDE
jgi:hypothetical protein